MDKAYNPTTWENRPSTASPLDEINLNLLSRGVSTIDDRVIALSTAVGNSVQSVVTDEETGLITVTLNDGTSYTYNPATKIYNTIAANQQAAQASFDQIAVDFRDVHDLLDDMDTKIDLTAEGANRGIANLQTAITQNDGYYRQEMSGIRTQVSNVADYANALNQATDQRITNVYSSITQTTEAIQLQVTELSESVDVDIESLQAQITTTAGQISLKVSKLEVIDDLQHEFGSGIQITPDSITFASTGSMVVNTVNFKLDEDGNAQFKGHVAMDSGSVGGVPIIPSPSDADSTLSVQHSHHSWKLRSAAINGTDERYYEYITANKNFIVTNSENGGHTAENDRTDDCSIGSYKYPWGKGYFNILRVQHHNVLPEGLNVTLPANGWTLNLNGYYHQSIRINGVTMDDVYLYIATTNPTDLDLVYRYNIDVDIVEEDELVRFLAKPVDGNPPASNVDVVLLAEDYIMSSIEDPELRGSFDQEKNQLSCNWSSPRDSSKFISWIKDELVIEKCIDESDPDNPNSWQEVLVVPTQTGGTDFQPDEFEDTPLVIGSADEEE